MSKLTNTLLVALAAFCFSGTAISKEYTKQEIETIIHDYLLENPEVLIEVGEKLRKQQIEDAKNADSRYLKTYKSDIYSSPNDANVGPKDAKNVIVEFSDYNCGYCKKSKQLFFKVLQKHAKKNDIRYVFKEYPILGPGSEAAARVSLAVYKTYPDQFLDYHMAVINSNKRVGSIDDLKATVTKLNMDWSKVKALAESDEINDILEQNTNLGMAMEVTGTPCYIINGKFIRGAPQSESYIESLLK